MLDHFITDDRGEETYHHKTIRKMIEESIHTCDDAEFFKRK
jgi:IS30 family transposase